MADTARQTRFIELSALGQSLDPASGDLEFVTPVALVQDLMAFHGKLTFTPIRNAGGMPGSLLSEVTDVSQFPVSQETHPVHGSPTADAFVQQLIPVFDTETTCRSIHQGRRRMFASNNGAASYVFPLEYTNPTPARYPDAEGASNMSPSYILPAEAARESGVAGLDCTDAARGPGNPAGADIFEPTETGSIVMGSVEYEALHFADLRNWSDGNVDKNVSRNRQYDYTTIRPPTMVTSLVIHDTTSNGSAPRDTMQPNRSWGPREVFTSFPAHFLVQRNGRVSQVADLLERLSQAGSHSESSIGIEVANDIMFQLRRGATQDPTDVTDDQFHADVPWVEWTGAQAPQFVDKMRIPPRVCLEELWGLVSWLTGGGHPVSVPLIFPQLDPRYWRADELARLPASFYGEGGEAGTPFRTYLDAWRGLGLPHADGAEADTATGGARYWHVQLRDDDHQILRPAYPGVYAHRAISDRRFDGMVNTLYLFFRSLGLSHAQAHRNARLTLNVPTPEERPARSTRFFVRLPRAVARHIPPNSHAAPLPPT